MAQIQTLITEFYFPVRRIDDDRERNLCIVCGVDMGACNPRQFCRKSYCENAYLFDEDDDIMPV